MEGRPKVCGLSFNCPLSRNNVVLSGLGLHLQGLAQSLSNKLDLHEPHKSLASLNPYDHLKRFVRVCYVHAKRNIQKCNVSDDVSKLMRSLLCVRHPDWDGTLERIRREGGKAGAGMYIIFLYNTFSENNWCLDWVQDKIRSKFAFPALCWEKSLIPIDIWKAGDSTSNIIESVHADVNREGVGCTLVGAVRKGQAFDAMKMKDLEVGFKF